MVRREVQVIPYNVGRWFGRWVVLPFAFGIIDAVLPELDEKIFTQVQHDISNAIPEWMKRYL